MADFKISNKTNNANPPVGSKFLLDIGTGYQNITLQQLDDLLTSVIEGNIIDLQSEDTLINSRIDTVEDDLANHTHANATQSTHGFMSSTDKTKLDGLDNRFKGRYASESALKSAHPTASSGDWALVNDGTPSVYVWDPDNLPSADWVDTGSTSTGDMMASVYDPTNVAGDAFDLSLHHGSITKDKVTGLQADLDGLQTQIDGNDTDIATIQNEMVKGVGVNGGTPATPDASGNVDLTGVATSVSVNGGTASTPDAGGNVDITVDVSATVDTSLSPTSTNPVENKAVHAALASKSDVGHTHSIAQVDGLQTELDARAKSVSVNGGAAALPDVDGNIDLSVDLSDLTAGPLAFTTSPEIDALNTPNLANYALTADTQFTIANLPANNKVIRLKLSGEFTATFSGFDVLGSDSGTGLRVVTITLESGATPLADWDAAGLSEAGKFLTKSGDTISLDMEQGAGYTLFTDPISGGLGLGWTYQINKYIFEMQGQGSQMLAIGGPWAVDAGKEARLVIINSGTDDFIVRLLNWTVKGQINDFTLKVGDSCIIDLYPEDDNVGTAFVDYGGGGGSGTITASSAAASTTVECNNIAGTFRSNVTLSANMTFTAGASPVAGGAEHHEITGDGTSTVSFPAGWRVYGINSGDVLEAKLYDFFFLYTGSAWIVNVPGSTSSSGTTQLNAPTNVTATPNGQTQIDITWTDTNS